MTENTADGGGRRGNRWRIAAWAAAALILLLPLFAMQVTDQVVWDGADFAIFGALLVGVGVIYELAARQTSNTAYRSGGGVALAAAFILVWVNCAVGIIGTERADRRIRLHRANLAGGYLDVDWVLHRAVAPIGLAVSECGAAATSRGRRVEQLGLFRS